MKLSLDFSLPTLILGIGLGLMSQDLFSGLLVSATGAFLMLMFGYAKLQKTPQTLIYTDSDVLKG